MAARHIYQPATKERAVRLYREGYSCRRVQDILSAELGFRVPFTTIEAWLRATGAYKPGRRFNFAQSHREILTLLQATPLTVSEIADIRRSHQPNVHAALKILERENLAVRRGTVRKHGPTGHASRQQLWHWTGKEFPGLPASLHLSERITAALAFSKRCETRLALLGREEGEIA